MLGYHESLPGFVGASREALEQARRQHEALLRRLKYWQQAASAAIGSGIGYGLLLVVAAVPSLVGSSTLFGDSPPPFLLMVFVAATFLLGFVVGQVNGFGIGLGLWIWDQHPLGRLAPAVIGASTGFFSYSSFLLLITDRSHFNVIPFAVGACLGAGLGLGAASSRRRVYRLIGTTAGAMLATTVVASAGWLNVLNGLDWPTRVVAGLALGLPTGLGLYLAAADRG